MSWRDGAQLEGGYVIGRRLGSGRFGEVFLVENRVLRRSWAAKVTRRALAADPERRRTLLGELARGFAVAGHPHIVRTEMFRSFGDEIAIFGELVEGGSLAEHLADQRFTRLDSILEVALQLAWALEAIHAAGMIHGDVKPANVLLAADGTVKLADLGLASLAAGEGAATPGTQLYRAPEQARGVPCTAATDTWSWAVTVIAMLLGEQPSHADGQVAPYTLAALRSDADLNRGLLDETLDGLLSECLQKHPERRPTAMMIVDRLAAHLAHRTGRELTRPAALPQRTQRRELASELAAHGEAMRLVLSGAGSGVGSQDAVLHVALAKVDCHRRGRDTAGAIATLDQALSVTPVATAPLRAMAWLELGDAYHLHGNADAALHAFKTVAALSSALTLRIRAYHGTALVLWMGGHGSAAIEKMHEAAMLATHASDVDPATIEETRRLRAMSLSVLAEMLHECGDRDAAVKCAQHLIDTLDPGVVTTNPFLARALLLLQRFEEARELLQRGEDPLLAAAIELEDAKIQARRGRPRDALACALRATTLLRPHAERGEVAALLGLAIAELRVAWFRRASGETWSNDSVERALVVVDQMAKQGRRDAVAVARWAREHLLASQ